MKLLTLKYKLYYEACMYVYNYFCLQIISVFRIIVYYYWFFFFKKMKNHSGSTLAITLNKKKSCNRFDNFRMPTIMASNQHIHHLSYLDFKMLFIEKLLDVRPGVKPQVRTSKRK